MSDIAENRVIPPKACALVFCPSEEESEQTTITVLFPSERGKNTSIDENPHVAACLMAANYLAEENEK